MRTLYSTPRYYGHRLTNISSTKISAVVIASILLVVILLKPPSARAQPLYPDSSVYLEVAWQTAAEVIRLAPGSDNWPLTWASDGNLYGAGGDGFGCDGSGTKWSLWVAQITGYPPNLTCADHAFLYQGNGSSGEKGSGMLSVNGTLYMWIRNVDNQGNYCGLITSTDHGQSWTPKKLMFEEFGYCTFLNFGQDYQGARDNYVYSYSHNHPSAYTAADHFILMRVPKDQITDQTAYEFFSGTAQDPAWSVDIAQRTPVFTHSNNARRSGISYHQATGRYLWWQVNGADTNSRFSGGFGIYEAPEPWGPWSIVYYTDQWDIGPGETGNFPTKWMSSDGTSAYLAFSGDDALSIRRADFTLDTTLPSPSPHPADTDKDDDVDYLDYQSAILNFSSIFTINTILTFFSSIF